MRTSVLVLQVSSIERSSDRFLSDDRSFYENGVTGRTSLCLCVVMLFSMLRKPVCIEHFLLEV